MKKIFVLLTAMTVAVSACGTSSASVVTVNPEEFAKKAANTSVVVLDVRTPGEFASGHIKTAKNIDFESGNFENQIIKLDKAKTYAVYCRSGNRSGQATSMMAKDGFKFVYNLDGGIINWINSGHQLVTE